MNCVHQGEPGCVSSVGYWTLVTCQKSYEVQTGITDIWRESMVRTLCKLSSDGFCDVLVNPVD